MVIRNGNIHESQRNIEIPRYEETSTDVSTSSRSPSTVGGTSPFYVQNPVGILI